MPEIKRFGGFKLLMFFQDENPRHVHIKGPDFAAKIRLSNGDLIAGDAPNRVLRETRLSRSLAQGEGRPNPSGTTNFSQASDRLSLHPEKITLQITNCREGGGNWK